MPWNAWFRPRDNECAARMPTMQLDRPFHDVLATTMPPGKPEPSDAPDSGHGSEGGQEDEEEANPS